MIKIALPKGRLGEKVYALFEAAGYECPSIRENNRKLIFENPEKQVCYFWVKPSDVPVYVERGAADVGVAGKDILLEHGPDVYELLDLGLGRCRMAVAAPEGFRDSGERTLKVATKFANIARRYYAEQGRDIDVIPLNGSIELAPLLGLSDDPAGEPSGGRRNHPAHQRPTDRESGELAFQGGCTRPARAEIGRNGRSK